ncbi:MAG: amino acid permease [Candidatus Thermoplasmatota archaeon]|nr:amino acid permease [Candidatus Thermoplasmatota archaeon]
MTEGFTRSLKLLDAVIINLGAIIGAGIFVIIGISAGLAGPAVILSIPLAALVAIFTGISFSQIARHVDKEGGTYEYGKESLSPFAGFLGGTLWTFGNIVALSAVSISFGGYLDEVLDSRFPAIFIGVGVIMMFAILNALGIKNSAKTLRAIVMVNLAILILFTVFGLFFFKPSHFSDFLMRGPEGIISGGAVIFFAFSGFSRVTTVSEEVINPERTIPLAIIISILISAVLYFLITLSAIGLATPGELASSTSPLALAASRTGLIWLGLAVSIGALVATSGVILTGMLGTSRVLYAMARDGELPRRISYLDRYSTPLVAIVISMLLAILMLPAASFGTIVESSNACVISAYSIINIAALKVHMKYRKSRYRGGALLGRDWFIAVPVCGISTIALFFAFLGTESMIIAALVAVASATIYEINTVIRGSHGPVPSRSRVRLFGKSREKMENAEVK